MDDAETAAAGDRNWTRITLLVCCLFVTVAAGMVIPTFASDGLAGSPIEQVLPGEDAGNQIGYGSGDSGEGGLGALNPGDTTGVGGDVGLDGDTFGSTDTELHFTVRSNMGTYWRTGAYDTYTGAGWEQSYDTEPLDGSIEHDGNHDERIEYQIELAQPATAVPTAWRPTAVDGPADLELTGGNAVRSSDQLDAGTTIDGVSYSPERDIGLLQNTGKNYPSHIESTYTDLPVDTPSRVEGHTADLTADDETPYEKAVTIEEWLKSTKEYDLDVSKQSDTIADAFIFEMDAGYCEYFATAMTTMLRSQDIPARYVVGYSTGQPAGEDTYEVRAMNAHAWVEVYFEDVGWVRFDPTPGSERLAAQEDALQDIGEAYGDFEETGSPGDIFDPDATEESNGQDGFDISMNQTAVPGEPVKVEVTWDDIPISDATVSFNNQIIGETDVDGTVRGIVPDDEELKVTVTGAETPYPIDIDPEWSEESDDQLDHLRPGGGSSGELGATERSNGLLDEDDFEDEFEETYTIERNATLSVSGERAPGETVTVTARVGNRLLDDATVFLAGNPVGETNENGQLDVTLPDETGDVVVAVERDSISGEAAIRIPELSVSVDAGTLPSMSLTTVTVEATLDDEAAAGIPVTIDGDIVATTGTDGTAAVRLPLSRDATLSVVAAGQTQQVLLSGLLLRFVLLSALPFALLLGLGVGLYHRGHSPGSLVNLARTLPEKALGTLSLVVVTLATRGDDLVLRTVRKLREGARGLRAVVTGEKSLEDVRAQIAGWIARLRARIAVVFATLRGANSDADGATDDPMTVQQAWTRFVGLLSVRAPQNRTPGELAAHAVEEDNLPEEEVATLRDSFRAVEYGHRSGATHLDSVTVAIEELEQSAETTHEDSSAGGVE